MNLKRSFSTNILLTVCFVLVSNLSFSNLTLWDWYTYTNTDLGYSLELPNEPNYQDDYDSFIIYSYNDTNSKRVYSFFALDLRDRNEDSKPSEIVDNFTNNIVNNLNGELLDKKEIKYSGGLQYKILVKINEEKLMSAQFTLQNNILYYLSVEDLKDSVDNNNTKRFFNSLKVTSAKPMEVKEWLDFVSEKGAFSITIPEEPTDLSREYPNPLEEDGEPYYLYLYSAPDYKNDDNYLFRYNDQPLGYFMEDPAGGFESMQETLTARAELLSPPKTIFLDGNEGREYELLLDGKFHTICRIYLRGNRAYLLLKQKLNEKEKATTDDTFFNSFKFEPYKTPELTTLQPRGTNFEVLFFDDLKRVIDTVGYESTYLKNSNDYFALNEMSGGTYQFGYSDLKDYFKIASKDEFFETNIDALKSWNDSIIKQKNIKVGNEDGVEFHFQNEGTKVITKHQLWLQNKRLFLMTGYLSDEERDSKLTDSIFNSFKVISKEPAFDVFSSKTDAIFNDLGSKDSIVYHNALGAFDYYEFETTDLPKLYEALNYSYDSQEKTNLIKDKIAEQFSLVSDSKTLDVLKNLYTNESTNDDLKATILTIIPNLENDDALSVYKDLFLNNPPVNTENYTWGVVSPFTDSLNYAIENYKDFSTLIKHEKYRSDVLDVSLNILQDSTGHSSLVSDNMEKLFQYMESDLQKYLEEKDKDEYDYSMNSLIYSYLNFLNKSSYKNEFTDTFTSTLAKEKDNQWFSLQATTARIINNYPLDNAFIETQMDSLFSRFEIMEAYHKTNQFNKVPKKYIKPEEFAKLALYNYVGEDEGYPDAMTVVGKIKNEGDEYYAISFGYEYEEAEDEEYLAIVGPIKEISQKTPYERYKCYTEWDSVEKDWKTQTKNLIPSLIEYGY